MNIPPDRVKPDLPVVPDAEQCIGKAELTKLIMNSVIGAGIFGLPSNIAQFVGPFALWAYVFGALMTAVIVAVVVELSSQSNESGGAYRWVTQAFGLGLGTQTGLFSLLARTTTAAAIVNLLTNSLASFWTDLARPVYHDICLVLVIGSLAAINVRSTRGGLLTSSVLLRLKLLPLVALVVAGLVHWNQGQPPPRPSATPGWSAWTDALIAMVFAFSGFESAMIPGRNIEAPLENVRPAAFRALLLIFALYFSLHLVVMRAVPALASSEHPLNDAAATYLGNPGQTLMAVAAVMSTLGWLSAAALSAPRLPESMARDGIFPRALAPGVTGSKPPLVSIVLWAVLVVALAIYGNFYWNVVLSVAARLIVYSTMCLSVPRLRKKYPHVPARRSPFGIAIPLVGMLICALLATRLKTDHLALMGIVGSAGVGIRFFTRHQTPVSDRNG